MNVNGFMDLPGWANGFVVLPWWGYILVALLMTHITIAAVTIYLHRHSAHRARPPEPQRLAGPVATSGPSGKPHSAQEPS